MDRSLGSPHPDLQAGPGGATQSQPTLGAHPTRRRKNHRGGKKKKTRRTSFAVPSDDIAQDGLGAEVLAERRDDFYVRPDHNLSSTSLDSEALLDHR